MSKSRLFVSSPRCRGLGAVALGYAAPQSRQDVVAAVPIAARLRRRLPPMQYRRYGRRSGQTRVQVEAPATQVETQDVTCAWMRRTPLSE